MDEPPNDRYGGPPTGRVPPPTVGRVTAAPPPPERPDRGRTLAMAAGGALAVLIVILGAVLLGLGPFSRTTPSPSPVTGVRSPTPSVTGGASATSRPSATATGARTAGSVDVAPTAPATRRPTAAPTATVASPAAPTAASTAPPTAVPTPTHSPVAATATLAPATPAPATPTLAPTLSPTAVPVTRAPTAPPTRPAGGAVSGELDTGTRSFLERIALAEDDLAAERLRRDGPLQAGTDLVDYAAFQAHNGHGVVWQDWDGPDTAPVPHLTDVRMAFPLPENAIGFMDSFGDEVARANGLTEFEAGAIGEESRAFGAVAPDEPGGAVSRYLHLWRRGDLVAFVAVIVRTDDVEAGRAIAHGLAARAGRKLDEALGIEPA